MLVVELVGRSGGDRSPVDDVLLVVVGSEVVVEVVLVAGIVSVDVVIRVVEEKVSVTVTT